MEPSSGEIVQKEIEPRLQNIVSLAAVETGLLGLIADKTIQQMSGFEETGSTHLAKLAPRFETLLRELKTKSRGKNIENKYLEVQSMSKMLAENSQRTLANIPSMDTYYLFAQSLHDLFNWIGSVDQPSRDGLNTQEVSLRHEARSSWFNRYMELKKSGYSTEQLMQLYHYETQSLHLEEYIERCPSESVKNFTFGLWSEIYTGLHFIDQKCDVVFASPDEDANQVDMWVRNSEGKLFGVQVKGRFNLTEIEEANILFIHNWLKRKMMSVVEQKHASPQWITAPSDISLLMKERKVESLGSVATVIQTFTQNNE